MRVAALVTEGLKTATDAIPHLSTTGKTTGKQELLRFMTSLLEIFFRVGTASSTYKGKSSGSRKSGRSGCP